MERWMDGLYDYDFLVLEIRYDTIVLFRDDDFDFMGMYVCVVSCDET